MKLKKHHSKVHLMYQSYDELEVKIIMYVVFIHGYNVYINNDNEKN